MSQLLSLVEAIDAWLPQTQCTRCGYSHCRPYAEAVACGKAEINRCPPGGEATINALAQLLNRTPMPLDPTCGATTARVRAVIDEAQCIGCTKCLPACPVDAIIGGPKRMHTVVEALCTGCELCIAPCPVDCIALITHASSGNPWPAYTRTEAARFRSSAERHFARVRSRAPSRRRAATAESPDRARIRAEIAEAVVRVRQRRQSGAN